VATSTRRHPFRGITTAESDKQDEIVLNRRVRHRSSQLLRADGDEARVKDSRSLYSDWLCAKDGKTSFDPERLPELMRK
jgi:hypothetical protein